MSTFNKPAINVEQQLAILQRRGLSIKQPKRAKYFLEVARDFGISPPRPSCMLLAGIHTDSTRFPPKARGNDEIY